MVSLAIELEGFTSADFRDDMSFSCNEGLERPDMSKRGCVFAQIGQHFRENTVERYYLLGVHSC